MDRRRVAGWTLSLLALSWVACSGTTEPGDGGTGGSGGDTQGAQCQVDTANGPDKALSLAANAPSQGYLCPPRDEDWFRFEVTADKPIVAVDLAYSDLAVSPVELAYSILTSDGSTPVPGAGAADSVTTDNHSHVQKRERLVAGTYYLRIYDFGGDDQDTRNAYTLTLTPSGDSDPNEPNDTCDKATQLAGTTATGAISFQGDKDAFAVQVPAGSQIVDVKVTSAASLNVAMEATLFDPAGNRVAGAASAGGATDPASVHLRQAVLGAGATYCLVLQDHDGTRYSDLAYDLAVTTEAEKDPNEQTARNDTADTATPVAAAGQPITGYIGSIGDVDWYKITRPAGTHPILELDLDCPGCSIETTFSLVAPNEGTTCDASSKCEWLVGNQSCQLDADCGNNACGDTIAGGKCALSCDPRKSGVQCPGFTCSATGQSGDVGACAGAAVCMPENKCGALQYTEVAPKGSNHIRTAQPFQGPVLYLAVRDYHDDEVAPDSPYSLMLNTYDDPDPNEPNNFYYPYTDTEANDVLGLSGKVATVLARTDVLAMPTDPLPSSYTWTGSGCIAYESDVDVFKLTGSASPCGAGLNCAMQIAFDKPATQLDLVYFLSAGTTQPRASFQVRGQPDGIFGNTVCGDGQQSECTFYYKDDTEDYTVIVRHFGQDDWDKDRSHCYHFTVTAFTAPGCPAACPDKGGNGLCTCGK